MKNTILFEIAEQRKVNAIRDRIMQNTYTDQDLILLFGIIKNNVEKLNLFQIKQLCELIQFLFVVKQEERLPAELLEHVDSILVDNT